MLKHLLILLFFLPLVAKGQITKGDTLIKLNLWGGKHQDYYLEDDKFVVSRLTLEKFIKPYFSMDMQCSMMFKQTDYYPDDAAWYISTLTKKQLAIDIGPEGTYYLSVIGKALIPIRVGLSAGREFNRSYDWMDRLIQPTEDHYYFKMTFASGISCMVTKRIMVSLDFIAFHIFPDNHDTPENFQQMVGVGYKL